MARRSNRKTNGQPRTFTCTFECGNDIYHVFPLHHVHPEVAARAYRFRKRTGDQAIYDVRLAPDGRLECDCPGNQRWGYCKHCDMLVAIGCLTRPAERPIPA